MADRITRRDFIHDVAIAGAGLAIGSGVTLAGAATDAPAGRYYPPTLTGLRGTHAGAFEMAHGLARQGKAPGRGKRLDEHYDLVVVGAGISGLAAAYFYRQQHGPERRILLLDNHDDFGGHAKRNEFHQGGRLQLAWGGTVNMEYWNYSAVGSRLLRELGVDIERLLAGVSFDWGGGDTGLASVTWFDKDTYGRDAIVPGFSFGAFGRDALREAAPGMPLSEHARQALRRFVDRDADVSAGATPEARREFIHSTGYADFLRDYAGLPEEAVQVFSTAMLGIWGVRSDDLSVAEALSSGLPGRHILAIPDDEYGDEEHGPAAMFPDGNASIARLLVRALIGEAFLHMPAGSDPFDIVTAELDYAQLDRQSAATRLRLNSTVLHVENTPAGDGVSLTYARGGELYTLSADRCVLACYNRIIPHICPSLPERQKDALAECVKRPMGTVNVVLKDGRAIRDSGVATAYLPGSLLQLVTVVTGVNAGPYQTHWRAEDPCQLHFFFGVPAEDPQGLSIVEQSRAGRLRLLAMDFDAFEREVRRVLSGIWGASGLDVDSDILAITVNRWPHGYARDLLDLEDPAWLASPGPCEVGRQTFGNIAIANSDAGADAYTHTAIDQAWRAIAELPASV